MALGYRHDPKGVALERVRERDRERGRAAAKKGNVEGERERDRRLAAFAAASDVTLGCLAGN